MGIKVFFNNSCSICRFEINHYKKVADSSLQWVDITNNEEALSLTAKSKKDLLRRLHIIDNGEIIVGAKAFIIIWSQIPKYKIISKVLGFKIFFYFFYFAYEVAAFLLFLKNKKQLYD